MDNDLAHDLKRARELLAKGKTCPYYRPDHNAECLHCDDWSEEHGELSEDERWQVYRLFASFTEILDTISPGVVRVILEAIEYGKQHAHDQSLLK